MLPKDLAQKFSESLVNKSFPNEAIASYLKWLRFYWDFCDKYHYDPYCPESLPRFLNKLVEKRQSEQQKQARHSITLFYRMQPRPVASKDAIHSADLLQAADCNQSAPLGFGCK